MPKYDYECDCGHAFEATNTIAERKTATCPKCGKDAKKTITAAQLAPSIANWSPHWNPED
jgi:putative FmdB family regulatory protein